MPAVSRSAKAPERAPLLRVGYSRAFYEQESASSGLAARVMVPLISKVVRPTSVVDVGCGVGAFLREFESAGITDLEGVEGDWIREVRLAVDPSRIRIEDISAGLNVDRTFDLALCLEVAEHLSPESGDKLIESLTRLAPVVAFSAAVPMQGGTNHLNEQWPRYWAARFWRCGFVPLDCLRRALVRETSVPEHYAQTLVLYVDGRIAAADSRFQDISRVDPERLSVLVCVRRRPRLSKVINILPPPLRERAFLLGRRATNGKAELPPRPE